MNNEAREHTIKLLNKNVRLDGRGPEDYREIVVETGVTKNAEGSARVKIGDTEVICGVKMSIEKPYPDTPDRGNIAVNVELLPMSSPEFESGPPGIQAIELARVVDRGIRESEAIDVKKLCVEKGEKVWTLFLDICTINDCGNLFDAASLAAIAALRDCRFPKYDGTEIDYKEKTDEKVPLNEEPVEVTVYKIKDYFLVDPTSEEEQCYDARLTIAFSDDGTICALQKGGAMELSIEEISKMVELGEKKSKDLRSKL